MQHLFFKYGLSIQACLFSGIVLKFLQLIVATVPKSPNEKAPEILTDDNIKLLFDIQKKVPAFLFSISTVFISI